MNAPSTLADVTAAVAAFGNGDRDAIRRMLGRDYFEHVPGPGESAAAEAVGALVADIVAAFPDLTIEVDELRAEGDVVVGRVTLEGTQRGKLWGVPGTGNRLSWSTPFRVRPVEGGYALNIDEISTPAILGLLRELELVNPPDQMHLPPVHSGGSVPELLLRLAFNGQVADKPCGHLDQVSVTVPGPFSCSECAPDEIWPTVRMCLICGHLGCCDTSLNKHARSHYEATGHPLIRSIHRDEAWMWCYEDGLLLGSDTLARLAARLGA
jgi:predicted ester cyclase